MLMSLLVPASSPELASVAEEQSAALTSRGYPCGFYTMSQGVESTYRAIFGPLTFPILQVHGQGAEGLQQAWGLHELVGSGAHGRFYLPYSCSKLISELE